MAESTAKASLQKHEKDLKLLEGKIEQVQQQMKMNRVQNQEHFETVEEQIANLNHKFQTTNDEITKKLGEVLEAVHNQGTDQLKLKEVSVNPNQTSSIHNSNLPPSSATQVISANSGSKPSSCMNTVISPTPSPTPTYMTQIMPTNPYSSRPYVPIPTYNPAFMPPYSLVPINASTTEPHIRPYNWNSSTTSNTKYSPCSFTIPPWGPSLEFSNTINSSHPVITPGSNIPAIIIPTQPNITKPHSNQGYSPVSNSAYNWYSVQERTLPRPQGPMLPFPLPKMDFPKFEGKDPRGWIKKCEKFFQLNPILDPKAKVLYAALYLEGEADVWYQSLQEEQPGLLWEEFISHICQRFATRGYENLVGQFNKLTQKGKVEEYVKFFEELKAYMSAQNKPYSENYFIESFLSGLKEEIATSLYVVKPLTLRDAINQARGQ